jgi:predicted ATP-binding protein involved in virulence
LFNNGQIAPYSMLSDGVRNLVAMISDLTMRCAVLNPWLSERVNDTRGVVLIDEVDLHLHPSWQRQVIPSLLEIFQNVQFFITTHSPQVISTVQRESVFILSNNEIKPVDQFTQGRDSNSVLVDIFDVLPRPAEAAHQLASFYGAIEKQDVETAEKMLHYLEEKWGDLDTDMVRARMFYEDLLNDL